MYNSIKKNKILRNKLNKQKDKKFVYLEPQNFAKRN